MGEIGSRHYDPHATEIVRCPYHDARRGGPMNQTAFAQLSRVWHDVLELASWLAGPDATVHRAWRAAIAGTRAPAVHAARCDGPVPRPLSALYKASLGFSQVLTAMLLADDGVADAPLGDLGDARSFLALLERDRWLVGAEQVCAGPAPMIAELFDALAQGGPPSAPVPASLDALAPVDAWIDDRTAWLGVQIVELGARREAAARGDMGALPAANSPWIPCLRSMFAVPGRRPDHARRLFPAGSVPAPVARLLAPPGD